MKKYSGFTLLEILLYVVIGGITLVIVAFSFVQITRLTTAFRVNNELNQTGENIIRQIQYNINNNLNDNKGFIISPIMGGGTSSLLKIQNNTSFVQYNITQNTTDIIYSQSSQDDIKLNPTNIQVLASSLSFEQINNQDQNSQNGIIQAVKVKFTLIYAKPTLSGNEYDAQKAFETVIPIEQAKQTSFTPILNDNPIIPAGESPNNNYGLAYSLRKLSGVNNSYNKFSDGYNGPAIRVRRDRGTDQSEMDIGFTSKGDLNQIALQNFVGYQNFLTQSEDITTTGLWSLNNITTISNPTDVAYIAPNGTNTAENVNLNAGSPITARTISKDTNLTNLSIYTDSYYVKANGYNSVQLAPTGAGFTGNTSYQNYNLNTGTLGSSSGMIAGQSTITSVGNGWYRISLSATANANGSGNITLAIVNSSSSARLETVNVASATNSIYVWGGQRHISSSLTSGPKTYQPTGADANTGYGYVTIWYDQSGNTNNAIQTNTSAQPQIIDGVNGIVLQNNKPSLQFDGNDELGSINAFSSNSPRTFWVGKRSGYTQSFLARNTTYATLTLGSDLFTSYYLNGITSAATSSSDSLSNLNLYYASGNTVSPISPSQFIIGRGAGSYTNLNGYCSEIMEYNNSPATDSVQINIKDYYGL
jgi:type II secretory pathway pseudopilin PulG